MFQAIQEVRGDKGDKGDTGSTGPAGAAGAQGAPGQDGAKGEQGVPGRQGEQGEQGIRGEQGVKGDDGDVGQTGATGPQGVQGEQGVKGDQGLRGAPGQTGATGARGPRGFDGFTGAQGVQGVFDVTLYASKGSSTTATDPDDNWQWSSSDGHLIRKAGSGSDSSTTVWQRSETGLTYPAWVATRQWDPMTNTLVGSWAIHTATEEAHLFSIPGPKGDMGTAGTKGDKGDTGATGAKGADGAQGPRGLQGVKGDDGDDGATGPQGPRGLPGPQGTKGDTGATGPAGADGGASSVPDATTSVKGKVELATNAEASAGTDTTRAVTPAGVQAALSAVSAGGVVGTDPDYTNTRFSTTFNDYGDTGYNISDNAPWIIVEISGDTSFNFPPTLLYTPNLNESRVGALVHTGSGASIFGDQNRPVFFAKTSSGDLLIGSEDGRFINDKLEVWEANLTGASSGGSGSGPATTTTKGIVEIATDAEARAGIDEARVITPATLKEVLSDGTANLLFGDVNTVTPKSNSILVDDQEIYVSSQEEAFLLTTTSGGVRLHSLNATTGVATEIGVITEPGAQFSPFIQDTAGDGDKLYGVTEDYLYRINTQTAVATRINSQAYAVDARGISFWAAPFTW